MPFWSRKQRIEDKLEFKYEKIKHLIALKIKRPEIQREPIPERIDHLTKLFKSHLEPIVPLYFCKLDNDYYVIDGQHRLEVFKELKDHHNDKVPCIIIEVESYKEVEEYFFIINDRLPLNEMWLQPYEIKHIIHETYKYFEDIYPNMFRFKKKKTVPRPYIDKEEFKSKLNSLFDEDNNFEIQNSSDLIKKINALNYYYSTLKPDKFPAKPPTCNFKLINKLRKGENILHLGLVPDWHIHLVHGVQPDMTDTQQNLPKTQLLKSWLIKYGNCAETKCYVCNLNDITLFNCHAGHIIARARGGKTTVENIIPICAPCNLEMGTVNLEDYKNKYYPS